MTRNSNRNAPRVDHISGRCTHGFAFPHDGWGTLCTMPHASPRSFAISPIAETAASGTPPVLPLISAHLSPGEMRCERVVVHRWAQIQVLDSLGIPVPYAILESPTGQRVVADGTGMAHAARATDGPWLARRIGYRPARSSESVGRIVLARLPALLPVYRVESIVGCSANTVAARTPSDVVDGVRALFAEYDERRALASREREGVTFAVEVTLEGEGGERFEGARDTVTMPMASPTRAYVAGRAIERVDGDWVLRRPHLPV